MPEYQLKHPKVMAESFNVAGKIDYRGVEVEVQAGQTLIVYPGGLTVLDTEDFRALFEERTVPVVKAYLP